MLTKIIKIWMCLVFCLAASYVVTGSTATAGYLYNNGLENDNYNAWLIDIGDGSAVADSFSLGSTSTITKIDFVAWVNSGDTPDTIDWAITTSPFGTAIPGASETGVALISNYVTTNDQGLDVYDVSFNVPSVELSAGAYWLRLQNGSTADDLLMAWDENDGASAAFSATVAGSSYGTPLSLIDQTCTGLDTCVDGHPQSGSETFQLEGASNTPEPGTLTSLLSGFLLLAGAATYKNRRKAFASSL
jgi:hypothetical protein